MLEKLRDLRATVGAERLEYLRTKEELRLV